MDLLSWAVNLVSSWIGFLVPVQSSVMMDPNLWPSVCFSSDEVVACRLASNEIQFCGFSKGFVNRLRVPGVAALELSKAPGTYVAAFVPRIQGLLLV
ncbi:hypothetical protein BC332_30498 [Capsicum chinense]|nr:hypothetical protein BC332_30498 [Capsicum chinense]